MYELTESKGIIETNNKGPLLEIMKIGKKLTVVLVMIIKKVMSE
jgi:hypothetical protein